MIYFDEYGNKFDSLEINDVTALIRDMFSDASTDIQCLCLKENIELIAGKYYHDRMREIQKNEGKK